MSFIVISRFQADACAAWSAPSAIGTAGLGVGGQAGAEVTDFLIVLNSKAASTLCLIRCSAHLSHERIHRQW
jgi:lipid-binding SYLF domain-containing protein